ncbi:hypothetical protein AW27_026370 [Streptomyces sp. PCS3-D2]|uniref:VG15 protein n=1 Tax=Streptomyces sp. PCS3-D2 TaxID=1460244 RepID=UPI00044A60A0|nr:hypothetical protein [Streptomyces sp. PCS3-D2]WKV74733.1 hypothetical protein AW27_026370 [Streptomyces sp. PCS3-D2]
MSPSPESTAHMEARARLAAATSRGVRALWGRVDRDNIHASWLELLLHVVTVVSGGQLAAASTTEPWLQSLLGDDPDRASSDRLVPSSLVGVTGNGLPLADVLMSPMWSALRLVTAGVPVVQAMARGQALLDLIVRTTIADTGRAADSVGMISRPAVTSYVRVVEAGACSRCVVLAGREYGVSSAFARHPRCHCSMEPVTREHRPTPTDPADVYAKMSDAQRRKTFGEAAVKAIDAGADIAQVVNARRGMASATVYGRTVQATTEGITRRGLAGQRRKNFEKLAGNRYRTAKTPRLMPEEIFRRAESREHAVRLLQRNGYIT